MVESAKRKKFHDKDKYYKLAKEQGYRSRAAFKLSQIHRQYPFLNKAKVILDLCAAPGGWTQVVARTCSSSKPQIIAVDILPIRSFGKQYSNCNITTIIGDITTDKCKADIRKAINKDSKVQVVLHDGAPNIGTSYDKDAYEQMELAVHALKCATDHLCKNGTFCTKIYRSRDYASFYWVVQQLFGSIAVCKPKASRSQSSEIFLICQDYLAPDTIDPKLLDPKYIFEHVEGETTGGGNITTVAGSSFNVFHKNWDQKKRQRDGYDMDHYDATMRHIQPVMDFVTASSLKDAIMLLSTCTGFSFHYPEGVDDKDNKNLYCQQILQHPLTTREVKECLTDLKVLNKADFKGLLTWREKMQAVLQVMKDENKQQKDGSLDSDSDQDEDNDDGIASTRQGDTEKSAEEEEEDIQKEIAELRARKLRERKRQKKKERRAAAKSRKQAALGMHYNAIEDTNPHDQIFSLTTLTSKGDLEAVSEVNLDQVTKEQAFGKDDSDDDDEEDGGGGGVFQGDGQGNDKHSDSESDDEREEQVRKLNDELDVAYERYLSTTKNGIAKTGTKHAKRSKKIQRQKIIDQAEEDEELYRSSHLNQDTKTYAKLLQGSNGGDDDSDSDDDKNDDSDSDDGFHAKPMTPKEFEAQRAEKKFQKAFTVPKDGSANPLIHRLPDDPQSIKTARWFSNPLFAQMGKTVEESVQNNATKVKPSSTKRRRAEVSNLDSDDDDDDNSSNSDDALTANQVLAMMPKTDKQKRHEKRIKAKERDERRKARRAKQLGEEEGEFALAPAENMSDSDDDDDDNDKNNKSDKFVGLSKERQQKILDAKKLIKAGLGTTATTNNNTGKNNNNNNDKFEIVAQEEEEEGLLPVMDKRKYDSDNEEYDSDDYAQTMALGTMMLRKSKAKQLVDASYNRYAWNDPQDLPEWFVDDENKHYRPQLPIPLSLIAKMKEKMQALSTRPIAKVAEARARKNKRARLKLQAAKKKAEAVANSSEMSETMKLKAISKALRSQDAKKPGKTYVVAKKGLGKKGIKGAKLVDKRMKNDKRSMERVNKKRKKGKQGGLTGSKKRRHHK